MAETNPFLPTPADDPLAAAASAASDAAEDTTNAVVDAVSDPSTLSIIGTFFKTLVLYIPNALVLFGFIIDTINQEFRYSIASLIGISSVFVNFVFGRIAKAIFAGKGIGEVLSAAVSAPVAAAAAVVPETNPFAGGMRGGFVGCTVPGFESIESLYAPQGLVLPAAIFMYLIMDFGTHRGATQNIGLGVLLPAILLAHTFVMYGLGCFSKYYWQNPLITILAGFTVGVICGISGWGVVKTFFPDKLPTSAPSMGGGSSLRLQGSGYTPVPNPSKLGPGGTGPIIPPGGLGSSQAPGVGTCSAPNDQDQFVCEAYRNGKLITTTMAE